MNNIIIHLKITFDARLIPKLSSTMSGKPDISYCIIFLNRYSAINIRLTPWLVSSLSGKSEVRSIFLNAISQQVQHMRVLHPLVKRLCFRTTWEQLQPLVNNPILEVQQLNAIQYLERGQKRFIYLSVFINYTHTKKKKKIQTSIIIVV